jgi:ribosomal protein S27AE
MNQTQRSIVYYSLLSFFGLFGAVLIAMIFSIGGAFILGADWMGDQDNQDRLVWAAMLLTVLIWLPFNLWCRRQVTCPPCGGSVFQTLWQVSWDFGEGAWISNVRTRCPRCGAQLP